MEMQEIFYHILNLILLKKYFYYFQIHGQKKDIIKEELFKLYFLNDISRIMSLKGELRIASDDYSYVCWIMNHILYNDKLVWNLSL